MCETGQYVTVFIKQIPEIYIWRSVINLKCVHEVYTSISKNDRPIQKNRMFSTNLFKYH